MMYHLWYSAEQKRICKELDEGQGKRARSIFARTDNGKIVEYTEMTLLDRFNPAGNFPDYVYLGTGEYDSCR